MLLAHRIGTDNRYHLRLIGPRMCCGVLIPIGWLEHVTDVQVRQEDLCRRCFDVRSDTPEGDGG